MNIGDPVCRRSYNQDIRFVIKEFKGNQAILSGIDYRLIADAELSDLIKIRTRDGDNDNNSEDDEYINDIDDEFSDSDFQVIRYRTSLNEGFNATSVNTSLVSGTKCGLILHIDGDKSYLSECLAHYKRLGVAATGINITESRQPIVILELLQTFNPNIVVITGHDSLSKKLQFSNNLNDYKNSRYFVQAVKIARKFNKNYDNLVIIAGGCKSYYEALMDAGANFASSPNRTLINVIDPVYIACKFATTSIKNIIGLDDICDENQSIRNSMGGIETQGQCRKVKPNY